MNRERWNLITSSFTGFSVETSVTGLFGTQVNDSTRGGFITGWEEEFVKLSLLTPYGLYAMPTLRLVICGMLLFRRLGMK